MGPARQRRSGSCILFLPRGITMHVRTGDEVLVITGKNKGQRGRITRAIPERDRIVVENINMVKKHVKARGPRQRGGIIEVEAPLHASKVMLICPNCGEATRVGFRVNDAGKKVRYCKKCEADIAQPARS